MTDNIPPSDARKIWFMHPDAKIPHKTYEHDAGHDCYLVEDIELKPYTSIKFRLGFGIQIKPGQMLTIRSRSSTKQKGVSCAQTTCDPGYIGELHGFLINHTNATINFKKGERAVQLVFVKLSSNSKIVEGQPEETARANRGFGSTGK